MSFEKEETEEGGELRGRRPPGNSRPGKATVRLVGRPVREKIINAEDELNLRIVLQSTRSVEEFLARC